MQLGRVIGTATSTVKHPTFQGERLLVVQLESGRRQARRRAGPGVRPAGGGAGRRGAGDERRPGLAGAARPDDAGPLERDGVARPMSDRRSTADRLHDVDAAVEVGPGATSALDRRGRRSGRSVLTGRQADRGGRRSSRAGCSRSGMPRALPAGIARGAGRAGTVVTPLARDLLKRRGIGLRFVSRAEAERVGNAGEWGFAIEDRSRAWWRRCGGRCSTAPTAGTSSERRLDDAARWVAEAPDRGALVLTRRGVGRGLAGVPGRRASGRRRPTSPTRWRGRSERSG